jgi:hypothetical protein
VQQAKYFSLILGCSRGAGHTEQTAIILRHVNKKLGNTEKHFVGFLPVEEAAAGELANYVLPELNTLGLTNKNCRCKDTVRELSRGKKQVL